MRRAPDGYTEREHLEAVERSTGRRPVALDAPEFPPGVEPLWGAYLELRAAAGSAGFGPARISHVEMEAWARLHGVQLSPWEVETLFAIDGEVVSVMGSDRKGTTNEHPGR